MVTTSGAPSYFLITLEFLECISWHNNLFLDPSSSSGRLLEIFLYGSHNLLNKERLTLYLVALSVVELRHHTSEVVHEMAAVKLADKDPVKFREHLLSILRKRQDIIEVSETYLNTFVARLLDCRKEMSISSSPADKKKLVPEGIAARVPYKGTLFEVIYQLVVVCVLVWDIVVQRISRPCTMQSSCA